MSDWCVWAASHGQPPGERSRSITSTACSSGEDAIALTRRARQHLQRNVRSRPNVQIPGNRDAGAELQVVGVPAAVAGRDRHREGDGVDRLAHIDAVLLGVSQDAAEFLHPQHDLVEVLRVTVQAERLGYLGDTLAGEIAL